jgi:DNA polymerase-3 subunit epsilon
MRQIVLDTETTGLEPEQGHRIIEIGCVELVERRLTGNNFHVYLQPDREIDAAAIEVHGITNEFLADKPRFPEVAPDLLSYLSGAELIIHNAPFDVGFLDAELARLDEGKTSIDRECSVLDTLVLARKKHPGQRNSLDALCGRYEVDNSRRDKHGALLDAEILADVYLAMTGGQRVLSLDEDADQEGGRTGAKRRAVDRSDLKLVVVKATQEELAAHEARLDAIGKACAEEVVWRRSR